MSTEYCAYNSVPCVESIRLMMIIEAKMGQNEEGQDAQLFNKLFAFSGLE